VTAQSILENQQTLLQLARQARQRGRHELAALVAEDGLRGTDLHNDFLEELSISGFYSAFPEHRRMAIDACETLLRSRQTPAHQRNLARYNSQFYARILSREGLGRSLSIEFTPPEKYRLMNTSLAWKNNELWAVVRSVNFDYADGAYISLCGETLHSINHLVRLDREGNILEHVVLQEPPGGNLQAFDRGAQDLRLFCWQERWFATATLRDRNPEFRCQMALLEFDSSGKSLNFTLLDEPNPLAHQKNWMPWVEGDRVGLMMQSEPVSWAELNPDNGALCWQTPHLSKLALHNLRGSSGWISYCHRNQPGWLAVVHDVHLGPQGDRIYIHRLLWMSAQGQLEDLSRPFRFFDVPVEYCSGLVQDFHPHSFLFSLSKMDTQAFLYRLSRDEMEALFEPLS
jgi:hypothetical protein